MQVLLNHNRIFPSKHPLMKPLQTVAAILIRNHKVLFVKRNNEPFKKFWCLPGGHINPGEFPKEAVIREIKEETNLDFIPTFLEKNEEHFPEINWHARVSVFSGTFSGVLKNKNQEVNDARWFSKQEIKNLKIAFNHQDLLEKYLVKHDVQKK